MDGTIFDSETVHREAWKLTANKFGQHFSDEMYLQFIGIPTPDCMKIAVKRFNNEVALQAFSDSYYEHLNILVSQKVPLKKGFETYFETIKKMGKPLGIVTSSPASGVKANFAHHDFFDDFSLVVTRDDVNHFKPHPEPYQKACKMLSISPQRVLVFEDSNTGATSAIDAGCYTVGIPDLIAFNTETAKRLHREISSFSCLL